MVFKVWKGRDQRRTLATEGTAMLYFYFLKIQILINPILFWMLRLQIFTSLTMCLGCGWIEQSLMLVTALNPVSFLDTKRLLQ